SMRRVEQRVPMLTPRCLALLLEAVVGEGVRPSRTAARATAPAALQALAPLTREPPFQAFVLQAAWQLLRAGTGSTGAPRTAWGLLGNGGQASSEGGSNIGDAQGNIAEAALVEESRQWLHLGLPLLRACEALILSATGAGQAGGVAGGKVVRKDGGDGLALVAVRCLDLLTQAASQEQLAGMLQEVLPRATPPGRQAAVAEPVAEPVAEAAFGNSSAGCQAGRDLGKGEAGEGEEKCNEEEDEQDEEAEDPMLTMQGGAAEAARGPAEAVHLRLAHLERLVVRLAQGGLPREAETLAGVVGRLAGGLPAKLAAEHTGFAERACCSALPQGCAAAEHPALARALVSLWLTLPEAPQDLKVALQLVEELHEVLGDEESDGAERSEKITVVNVRTARSVAAAVLGHAEAALEDAEWVLGAMRVGGSGGAGVTAGGGDARGAARSRVEAAVYERLDGVVQILAGMCRITELPGAVAETVLRVLTRVYKALEVAAKALLAPKGVKQALPARQFSGLVEGCARELTPQVYEFIRIMQQAECENEADGGAGKASAAQIKREAR
ncbi:hypothetical protein CYMTET_27203, partial [Cymbomonas tetramitiformis]